LTFVFADRSSFCLALLNVAVLPIYGWLEDRRLVLILGDAYQDYRSKVPAYLAIRSWFAARLRPAAGLARLSRPTSAQVAR
jgi:hypothetical protein